MELLSISFHKFTIKINKIATNKMRVFSVFFQDFFVTDLAPEQVARTHAKIKTTLENFCIPDSL